jgi:hypothetical protein
LAVGNKPSPRGDDAGSYWHTFNAQRITVKSQKSHFCSLGNEGRRIDHKDVTPAIACVKESFSRQDLRTGCSVAQACEDDRADRAARDRLIAFNDKLDIHGCRLWAGRSAHVTHLSV